MNSGIYIIKNIINNKMVPWNKGIKWNKDKQDKEEISYE